jgi:MFS transporter, DHA2 family, multidrug resistance protein
LMLAGTLLFGSASAVAAYSTGPAMLIAARTAMGIGGATLAPSALALLRSTFHDDKQRAKAVAIWMSCFMGGAILGPIVGGVLLSNFWWGSVFLLAVPGMALVLISAPFVLPEFRGREARLDLISVVVSLAAVLLFIYGVTELAQDGWAMGPVAALVVGVLFGIVFIVRQRRLSAPLLDLVLFGNRTYRSSFVLSLLGGMTSAGVMLLINLYLQAVDGYSPLRTGLWLVPTAVAMLFTIGLGPAVARQVRPAYVMAAGMAVSVAGYLILTQLPGTGGLALVIVGWGLAIAGLGPATSLGYDMILSSAPPERAGAASASVETGGQLGSAAGIAIMGSIATAVYRSSVSVPGALPASAAATAKGSISGAVAVASHVSNAIAAPLLSSARDAFTGGLHAAAAVGAGIFAVACVFAARSLRHIPPSGEGSPGADAADAAQAGADSRPSARRA